MYIYGSGYVVKLVWLFTWAHLYKKFNETMGVFGEDSEMVLQDQDITLPTDKMVKTCSIWYIKACINMFDAFQMKSDQKRMWCGLGGREHSTNEMAVPTYDSMNLAEYLIDKSDRM